MSRRTLARLAAPTAAAGLITLFAVAPASAHVTVTPSETDAGSYTVLTVALAHGCEGSPTTALEVQVPEGIFGVTPTRSPFWTAEPRIEQLDEPATDAHGNEVTERTASVRFEALEPLEDGVRDSVELQLQIPEDLAGQTLAFPTIQECEEGRTAWTQVPEEGQGPAQLDTPAPSFVVTGASDTEEVPADDDADEDADEGAGADVLGVAGLVAGLLGLAAGGAALARSRARS